MSLGIKASCCMRKMAKFEHLQNVQLLQRSYGSRNRTTETAINQESGMQVEENLVCNTIPKYISIRICTYIHLLNQPLYMKSAKCSYRFVSFFKFPIHAGIGPVKPLLYERSLRKKLIVRNSF